MPLESFNVYREQLSSLHHGVALWEPNPMKDIYDQVEIGDVGYVHEGFFYRMFNVTLPSSHPSNNKLGKPDDYTPLDCGPFVNIREACLAKGDHYSSYVSREARGYNVAAVDPSDAEGNKYECRGQGALLSLPHDGHRKDVIRTKAFEKYIRENVAQWFAWSQTNELDVERMEDLILVSGCTLVTSWAAAAFVESSVKTDICLAAQPFDNGGARFTWSNIHGIVANHNSHSGPDAPLNQCIFIRGFRAKRVLFWTRPIRAAAEPLPDDPDNYWADEIQVTRVSDPPNYRDPLVAILDYIAENCPQDCTEDTIAIAHENDLQLIENVEYMTASAVETFLREHQIPVLVENGAATLRDGEPPVPDDAKVVFYATVESEGEPVPLAVHPVLSEYLLRLKITGPVNHDYDLPPEEMTSLGVHPPMLSLILENHQGYSELIYIRASSGVGVTVEDVLRAIHEELRGPLPRSRLTKLLNVGRYLLNGLFHAGRKTKQQDVASCRFEHLGGRDRLQILPKHPVEDTTPRGPISSSTELLDEPSPLAVTPRFINTTPKSMPYTTSALGSIQRTVRATMPSHEGVFPAYHRDPGWGTAAQVSTPPQPVVEAPRQPDAEDPSGPSALRRSPSPYEREPAHHRDTPYHVSVTAPSAPPPPAVEESPAPLSRQSSRKSSRRESTPHFEISALDPSSGKSADSTSEQPQPMDSPMPQASRSRVQSIGAPTSQRSDSKPPAPGDGRTVESVGARAVHSVSRHQPFNIYREQLSSLYHGVALWEPNPLRNIYNQVSIGDVGYVQDGFFYRMFNVTLPWNDPSNQKLGEPEPYKTLVSDPFINIRETTLAKGDYYSRLVSKEDNASRVHSGGPDQTSGFTYKCSGPGALLHLPHDGQRLDVIRTKVFEDYVRDNVVTWFNWAQKKGLGVKRMEDLILVTGCTLVTSWAAAVFVDNAEISLAIHPLKSGGENINWSKIQGTLIHHNRPFEPNPARDQCVFVRGFRAKRVLFRIRVFHAA